MSYLFDTIKKYDPFLRLPTVCFVTSFIILAFPKSLDGAIMFWTETR